MRYLYVIIVIFFLFGCNRKDDSTSSNEYAAKFVRELNKSDTFRYEFPLGRDGKPDSLTYDYLKNFGEETGIPSLEKGYDSIAIQIRFECFLFNRIKIVTLRHNREKWSAELAEIEGHFNEITGTNESFSKVVVYEDPKSGWIKFINDIFDLKVLTIEDATDLPGYKPGRVNDGCAIDVCLTTKNTYRYYYYNNPDAYSEFWQANNMVAIEKLLYSEFSVLSEWDEELMARLRKNREEKESRLKEDGKSGKLPKVIEVTLDDIPDTIGPVQKDER